MSGLSMCIGGWNNPFFTQPFTRGPAKVQQTSTRIDRLLAGIEAKKPPVADLQASYAELRDVFERFGNLETVGKRALRHAPWIIFEAWDQEPPLIENQRFIGAYLRRLLSRVQSRLITGFAIGLLFYYPVHLAHFSLLANIAEKMLTRCARSRCRLLLEDINNHGLLKEEGPRRFWQFLQEQSGSMAERLAQTNSLSGLLLNSGFLAATLAEALRQVRHNLGNEGFKDDFIDSLLALALITENGEMKHRFAIPAQRQQFADSLLLPFQERSVSSSIQQKIAKVIFRLYGDPRFDRSRWLGVDERAVKVALDWLIQDTLEDFFRLLAYFAQGNEVATRHWRYRQAFWTAYLRKGVIQEAWVVLGPKLSQQAAQILGKELGSFAKLERGPGVLANHSALIMRIGDLVITEWSHDGKFRVWPYQFAESGLAPKMYQSRYTRTQLIENAYFAAAHQHSERGTWQKKLADYIYQHTGISIRYMDYMP